MQNQKMLNSTGRELLIAQLNGLHSSGQRVRLFTGDKDRMWDEKCDVIGRIYLGARDSYYLFHNWQSRLGSPINLDTLQAILYCPGGRFYWRNPVGSPPMPTFKHIGNVVYNSQGEVYANCKSPSKALALAEFMNGTRFTR